MRVLFTVPGRQVSTNAAYRGGRGRMWMTHEASDWKSCIADQGRLAMGKRKAIEGEVRVVLDLYFGSRRPDLDGPLKLVLDALQPHVILNDRQVVSITLRKHLDAELPRTHIEVATVDAT